MKRMAAGIMSVLLLLVPSAPASAQTMQLGEVLVFHVPDLKPDAELKAFEACVTAQLAPAWAKHVPGTMLNLVKKDRGPRPGQYMLVWTTDTLAHHKGIASADGDYPFSWAVTAKAGDVRTSLMAFVSGPGKYSEYHLIAPEKVGASLPVVEVLGNHYIKVRPDRTSAFDQFVTTKLHPAVGNLRPDLRLLYYKPIRGEAASNYITVFALTLAARDKYWPNGADSDDVKAAFSPTVTALTPELQSYLVDGSWGKDVAAAVYEAKEWSDWTVLGAK